MYSKIFVLIFTSIISVPVIFMRSLYKAFTMVTPQIAEKIKRHNNIKSDITILLFSSVFLVFFLITGIALFV